MRHQTKKKPLDHQYGDRLSKVTIGGWIKLTSSLNRTQAWYRAARLVGVKISIRSTPEGVKLWRIS